MEEARKICEQKILDKMKEIHEIYKEYNPEGRYLTLSIVDDSIMFWNSYHVAYTDTNGIHHEAGGDDVNTPIDCYVHIKEDEENGENK